MTTMLRQAFDKVSQLPEEEQDLLASWLMTELEDEDAFDAKIAATAHKLIPLSRQAIADHRAGHSEELDPEKI